MSRLRAVTAAIALLGSLLAFPAPALAAQGCGSGNDFNSVSGPFWVEGQQVLGTTAQGIVAQFNTGTPWADCVEFQGDPIVSGFMLGVELHDADGETTIDNGWIFAGIMWVNTNGHSWATAGGSSDCPEAVEIAGGTFFVITRDYKQNGPSVLDCQKITDTHLFFGNSFKMRINADVNGHDFEVYTDTNGDGSYEYTTNVIDQAQWTAGSNFVAKVKLVLLDPNTQVGKLSDHDFMQSVSHFVSGPGWLSPGWDSSGACLWDQSAHYDCDVTSGNSFGTWWSG